QYHFLGFVHMTTAKHIDNDVGSLQFCHATEECGEPPKLVLAPGLKRVVVALRALDAASPENPNHLRHHDFRCQQLGIPVKISCSAAITLGGNSLPRHLVVRLV